MQFRRFLLGERQEATVRDEDCCEEPLADLPQAQHVRIDGAAEDDATGTRSAVVQRCHGAGAHPAIHSEVPRDSVAHDEVLAMLLVLEFLEQNAVEQVAKFPLAMKLVPPEQLPQNNGRAAVRLYCAKEVHRYLARDHKSLRFARPHEYGLKQRPRPRDLAGEEQCSNHRRREHRRGLYRLAVRDEGGEAREVLARHAVADCLWDVIFDVLGIIGLRE
mmetsp:Transcript_14170/g.38950  ORF Transcript_14170/g.38950 Transcript_14170/m.38950 type:complete len:218 (+) Transcript_14170:873-1526(+)